MKKLLFFLMLLPLFIYPQATPISGNCSVFDDATPTANQKLSANTLFYVAPYKWGAPYPGRLDTGLYISLNKIPTRINFGSAGCNCTAAQVGAWSLTGNSGTVAGTNFIGTTDNVALQFRISNRPAGVIDSNSNTAFGLGSLPNTTGVGNSAFGYGALRNNTTGISNTALGFKALALNTTGIRNVAIGQITLGLVNGDRNVGVGFNAFHQLTSGGSNVAIGNKAGAGCTSGNNNTFVGDSASGTSGLSNATAIGYNARVDVSDALVLGNSAVNVGIGTTSPTDKLHVEGSLRLVNGTEGAGKLLTSDANGVASWIAPNAINYAGIPEYANNAAAFAVLGAGKFYYTDVAGEYIIKVTH